MSTEIIPSPLAGELVPKRGVDDLLNTIRPAWKSRDLIVRVNKLLPVDPSSACQKLLNAALWDLREKIIAAGLDLAQEAASLYALPVPQKPEDILESYSAFNVLELSYRMGLLDRAEWKRLRRAYDIRRDLEHEDNEYVAEVEDVVYIFKSTIEIVLSRDPVEILRVPDVKELIEAPNRVTLSTEFVRDYSRAPDTRQAKIAQFLIDVCLNPSAADVTRQNAIEALRQFGPLTSNNAKIQLGGEFQNRSKRHALTAAQVKVAVAANILPYLKQRQVEIFFQDEAQKFGLVSPDWTNHSNHGALLEEFEDFGGLVYCPSVPRESILTWLVRCYIGEPGQYGYYGRNRKVFYSNAAAPRILRLVKAAGPELREALISLRDNPTIKAAKARSEHVAARFDELLGVIGALRI